MILKDSDRWFTSENILAAVAEMWPDGITLDPAWDPESRVVADKVYDARTGQDGLLLPWHGRVWCNGPWSSTGPWCMRAAQHAAQGGEVLLFVPCSLDTVAVQTYVLPFADVCLLSFRPKFTRPGGGKATPSLTPCMVCYFGPHRDRFARVFSKLGTIVRKVEVTHQEAA